MMKMIEVRERIEREAAENARSSIRFIVKMDVGQIIRQGDVYLHRVADSHPRGRALESRQLAIGVTQGSRHVAEAPALVFEGTTVPEWTEGVFLGPCVTSETRFVVSHPEHADISLPPGTYQVSHQLDARTMRRVQD